MKKDLTSQNVKTGPQHCRQQNLLSIHRTSRTKETRQKTSIGTTTLRTEGLTGVNREDVGKNVFPEKKPALFIFYITEEPAENKGRSAVCEWGAK